MAARQTVSHATTPDMLRGHGRQQLGIGTHKIRVRRAKPSPGVQGRRSAPAAGYGGAQPPKGIARGMGRSPKSKHRRSRSIANGVT